MTGKPIKVPGPEHPIDITSTKGRVTAIVNGIRIADSPRRQDSRNRREPHPDAVSAQARDRRHSRRGNRCRRLSAAEHRKTAAGTTVRWLPPCNP
jgi:hypothetical protein